MAVRSFGKQTRGGTGVLRDHHVMDYELDHRKPRNEHGETRDEILVTDEAPGGFVVLNRPRRLNALDLTTVRLLDRQIKLLDHAKHVRYIFFRGAGHHFSGGADYKGTGRCVGWGCACV